MSDGGDAVVITRLMGDVARAAQPFESRWTMAALRRVDAELHRRFADQQALFDKACVTGELEDVERHGAALCRGYLAIARAMEAAEEPDDAYLLGQSRSGLKIAIGHQKAAAERVRDIHGGRVAWLTPDECAEIFAELEGFKMIGAIKRRFPGAEIIDLYPGEPAKAESGIDEACDGEAA